MNMRLFLLSFAGLPLALAQSPSAPATTEAPRPPTIRTDPDLLAAKPGEPVLLPKLLGVRLIASPDQLKEPGFPARGFDATRFPWIDELTFAPLPPKFMDKPASQASLHRLTSALRIYASLMGHSFVSVYLPPQDITGGYVQIVISEAKADTTIGIHGAKYFSESSYRAGIRQQPGEPVDKARLEQDVAWLNRNPYRQVQLAAASGATAGSTALGLEVEDRLPWSLSAGYDNTGTANTDENRVSAGVTWANAFGRGDEATYRFIADPRLEHSKTHSFTYTDFLPWRHILTLSASYTALDTIMPEPFTQKGTSWQVGARYEIPLAPLRNGWTQTLTFSGDLKYSDNNLEFASVPITNNPTEIAEFGATYGVSFRGLGGQNSITVSAEGSPGGLVHHDSDRAFNGSRFGAKAEYVYGTLTFSHEQPLPHGFSWTFTANTQMASTALLGSEQLNGGGSGAVRGYPESTAFGDAGIVASNELHAPGFSICKGRDNLDLFAFVDVASLNSHGDDDNTDLRSGGVGLTYQFGRYITVRAAYGWHPSNSNGPKVTGSGHGHFSANLAW